MLEYYEKVTGFKETEPNAIMHHRIAQYGPPCENCESRFLSITSMHSLFEFSYLTFFSQANAFTWMLMMSDGKSHPPHITDELSVIS